MSSLSCLRGSQACLNCLLASKPLICKLAPLVLSLSPSLSFTLPPSLCFVCPPLSFLLFVCVPQFCPPPSPFALLSSSVSFFPSLSVFAMMYLRTENDTINFPLHLHAHTLIMSNSITTYAMFQLLRHLKIAISGRYCVPTCCPLLICDTISE